MSDAKCNASACGTYNYDGAGVAFGKRVRDSGGGFIACAGICRAVASAATGGRSSASALCQEALASAAASGRRSDWTNRRLTWAWSTSDPGAPSHRRHCTPHIYVRTLVVHPTEAVAPAVGTTTTATFLPQTPLPPPLLGDSRHSR